MGITQTTIKGKTMRKGTRRVTAAIFALGLVAAACGGDDSTSSEETAAPTETEAAAARKTACATKGEIYYPKQDLINLQILSYHARANLSFL